MTEKTGFCFRLYLPLLSCLAALFYAGCSSNSPTGHTPPADVTLEEVDGQQADSISAERTDEAAQPLPPKQTRLRYPNFTLVLHNFWAFGGSHEDHGGGYEYELGNYPQNLSDTLQATLNYHERDNEDYLPTLLVKADTLQLHEDMDERINNTLLQIIPKQKTDRFRISMCELVQIPEIIDYRNHSREVVNKFYENQLVYKEVTRYEVLPDSASFYFRALPNTPDMVQVTVKNNEVVPVKKTNTAEQVAAEEKRYVDDRERIKKKYGLHDTLVEIPGEYTTYAELTKNKRLFGYHIDSYLFKIERLVKNKVAETKYLTISIMYGC